MSAIPILAEIMDIMLKHPVLSFALLVGFLSADSWLGFNFHFSGVAGTLVSFIFGVPVSSGQLTVVLVFSLIAIWVMNRGQIKL